MRRWLAALGCLCVLQPAPAHPPEERQLTLTEGKSAVIPLGRRVTRLSVGAPQVADVILLRRRELYLVGKSAGSTNVLLWLDNGDVRVFNLEVERDVAPLAARLHRLLPGEPHIEVSSSGESVVLSGTVSDVIRAEQAQAIAQAFLSRQPGAAAAAKTPPSPSFAPVAALPVSQAPGIVPSGPRVPGVGVAPALGMPHIINLLTVVAPRQIMVEVKVAEVSRLLMEQLGSAVQYQKLGNNWSVGVLSNLLTQGPATITFNHALSVALDGQHSDGLVKILAEPTVMALSGQEAHFLAGGKVFIPTSTPNGMGGSMVTLTEQEYGVSLHFLPKVLEGDQIWLTVSPEVSELNPQGITVGSGSGLAPTILPTFTTRRASTTVQLRDGEHFVIGGLVRNNVTASVNAVPFLGEIPLLGALFRSPDFQSDKTELVFVVTPHLMQPSDAPPVLPTDGYHEPGPVQRLLGGRLEGRP
ncbi:MAG: type II and III secretion system protein family protein [Betaproteobacteria bacterium]|nr:type II and III secretion system protein family protein [Betaproteobacteria bacterium]